jgi:hypothetical protein
LWVGGLVLGFGLIHFALRPDSFVQALYFSGITFFTVGYGDLVSRSIAMKAVAVVEAGSGLGFLALVIGYLPVLYQLFARREAHVMLLDERAGSPPTATELLKRHSCFPDFDLIVSDFFRRPDGSRLRASLHVFAFVMLLF